MKTGWNQFVNDETAIYDDQLQYAAIARTYAEKQKSSKTFSYYASEFLPEMEGSARKTYLNYVGLSK